MRNDLQDALGEKKQGAGQCLQNAPCCMLKREKLQEYVFDFVYICLNRHGAGAQENFKMVTYRKWGGVWGGWGQGESENFNAFLLMPF